MIARLASLLLLLPSVAADPLDSLNGRDDKEANLPPPPVPLLESTIYLDVCIGELKGEIGNEQMCPFALQPWACAWYITSGASFDLQRANGVYVEAGQGIGAYAGYHDPCPPY